VRGGTLPWGELERELDGGAHRVPPWPARDAELPPASAVRGGTLPWQGCFEHEIPAEVFALEIDTHPPPVSLRELLTDALTPRSTGPESTHALATKPAKASGDEPDGAPDLTSAIQAAAERKPPS
jgi:hypothetical protein